MKNHPATSAKPAPGVPATGQKARRAITPLLQQALDAGRRVCDDMQDSPAARQQMKREILELADNTPHLLAGLVVALSTLRCKRSDFSPTQQPQPKE